MDKIDNIMKLANAYAESYRDALAPNVNALVDEAQTALRTALTEALAQQSQTTGCTSNCDNCTYAHGSPAHAGYCYMFYAEPQGVCAQWKDAFLTNDGTKPQTDMPFVPWEKEDAEGLLQDVAAYIGVGGFNGATPKQLSERICAEFERLNNKTQTAQPVREPLNKSEWPKHPSAYVNDECIGYSKSELNSYAIKVLQAHGIGSEQ